MSVSRFQLIALAPPLFFLIDWSFWLTLAGLTLTYASLRTKVWCWLTQVNPSFSHLTLIGLIWTSSRHFVTGSGFPRNICSTWGDTNVWRISWLMYFTSSVVAQVLFQFKVCIKSSTVVKPRSVLDAFLNWPFHRGCIGDLWWLATVKYPRMHFASIAYSSTI